MDPNATLTTLQALAHELINGDEDTYDKLLANAVEMGEAFQALDEWLARGGFQPATWAQASGGPSFKPGDTVRNRYTLATFAITADNAEHFIAAHSYYELMADNG